MKKILPLIGIFLGALVLVGALFVFLKGRKVGPGEVLPTPTPTPVSLEERPYITLTPRDDGHELKLEIDNILGASLVEYELVYLAGDVSRGVIGSVDLKGTSSLSRNLLLGSCSKNVCKYDEGVTEGTLTLRFRGAGTQKYEVPFRLQTGSQAKQGLTSGNGDFTFSGSLPSSSFYLTLGTMGVPGKPKEKIIGGPYGIFTASSKTAKGSIRIRYLSSPGVGVKVLGWESGTSSWKEYAKNLKIESEFVSVEADRLTTFIAVSP